MKIIQVFDSNAGELSPASFADFSLPYLHYIANHLPSRLEALNLDAVPMTVFAKGAWYAQPDLFNSNYQIISLDWLHDPAEAYVAAQAKGKVLQGNLDPGVLYGSDESIEAAVETMVKGFGGGKKGWICNLGHGESTSISRPRIRSNGYEMSNLAKARAGVTPFIKKEKLRFFFQTVHKYGSR